MSLRVWLPLNGNINNQGLDEVTTTSLSSVGFSDFGKIGKSLNVTTDGMGVSLQSYMNTCSKFSTYTMCAWIYMNSAATNHSSTILSSGDWNQATKQCCFGVYNYNSGYTSILIPNKSSWQKNITVNEKIKLNTWYHICITYDGSVTKAYVDGKYVGSSEFGGITSDSNTPNLYIGRATYYTGFTLHGNINDVRIYDHCLSTKEVKELSKGLVLHYKLSRGGENLLTNSIGEFSATNTSTSSYLDFKLWTNVVTPESDSYYTVSFDAKGGTMYQYLFNNSSGRQVDYSEMYIDGVYKGKWTGGDGNTGLITLSANYKHIVIVRHFNTNTTALSKTLLFRIWSGASNTVTIKNVKLEKGNKATPWIPNKSDTLYSQLGYNNIEPDCSGYGNNGTITGTLTYSNDTPRYLGSTFFPKTGITKYVNLSFDSFTISFWGKHTEQSKMLMGSMPNSTTGETSWYWYGDNSFKFPLGEYYYQKNAGSSDKLLGTWIHFVAVYDGANLHVYRNSIYEGKKAFTGLVTLANLSVGIGYGVSYFTNGNVSDFRIYATALSADDIKALYNTPISIDDKNTLHCTEIIE